jgi:hypothetical protein
MLSVIIIFFLVIITVISNLLSSLNVTVQSFADILIFITQRKSSSFLIYIHNQQFLFRNEAIMRLIIIAALLFAALASTAPLSRGYVVIRLALSPHGRQGAKFLIPFGVLFDASCMTFASIQYPLSPDQSRPLILPQTSPKALPSPPLTRHSTSPVYLSSAKHSRTAPGPSASEKAST